MNSSPASERSTESIASLPLHEHYLTITSRDITSLCTISLDSITRLLGLSHQWYPVRLEGITTDVDCHTRGMIETISFVSMKFSKEIPVR